MRKGIGIIGVLLVSGMLMLIGLSPSAMADGQSILDGGNSENEEISIGTDSTYGLDVFFIRNDVEMMRLDDGVVVFNENSGDIDFRIEGDNDANLFFGDAGTDRVGIGTASPGAKLDVHVTSGGAATLGHSTNSATGDFAVATGEGSGASGYASTAMGYGVVASGDYSFSTGWSNVASGESSAVIGSLSSATGEYSMALGMYLTAGPADNTFVLGTGIDYFNQLTNNIENSFMVGFDSTTPTLFVDGSSVGIGTTNPTRNAKLHIRENSGDSAIAFSINSDNPQFIMGMDNADNKFKIQSGNTFQAPSDVVITSGGYLGIGIDSPSRKLEVYDASGPQLRLTNYAMEGTPFTEFETTSSGYLYINPSGNNVGIGTNSPTGKLDINGNNIRIRSSHTPPSCTAAGNVGEICWDSNYLYVCVGSSSWGRAALTTSGW